MNRNPRKYFVTCYLLTIGVVGLALPLASQALPVALATAPLATSTTTTVKPNLMFVLDNSGSMNWEYLPDTVNGDNSRHCFRNYNYNGVYYNQNMTYTLPVTSAGANYPSSTFTGAWDNGFSTGAGITNLSNSFRTGNDTTNQPAYLLQIHRCFSRYASARSLLPRYFLHSGYGRRSFRPRQYR